MHVICPVGELLMMGFKLCHTILGYSWEGGAQKYYSIHRLCQNNDEVYDTGMLIRMRHSVEK